MLCPFAVQKPIGYNGGSYTGGPFRVVWHTTEGSSIEAAYAEFKTVQVASHFIVDGAQIWQLIDTNVSARALRHNSNPETNRLSAIQVELVGFAGKPKPQALLNQARKLALWFHTEFNIPWTLPNGPFMPPVNGQDGNKHNRSVAGWLQGGNFGHEHVPENIHWDPAFTAAEAAFVLAPTTPAVLALADDGHGPLVVTA